MADFKAFGIPIALYDKSFRASFTDKKDPS